MYTIHLAYYSLRINCDFLYILRILKCCLKNLIVTTLQWDISVWLLPYVKC